MYPNLSPQTAETVGGHTPHGRGDTVFAQVSRVSPRKFEESGGRVEA